MSESASPQGASSKSSRSRKSAVKKPRKSRSAAQEPATPAPGAPTVSTQAESTPALPETPEVAQTPEVQVHVRSIRAYDKLSMIATAAYYRAEHRRFAAGHELEDWLAAEAEIEALMRARVRSS
jgi:hypothetical protein